MKNDILVYAKIILNRELLVSMLELYLSAVKIDGIFPELDWKKACDFNFRKS